LQSQSGASSLRWNYGHGGSHLSHKEQVSYFPKKLKGLSFSSCIGISVFVFSGSSVEGALSGISGKASCLGFDELFFLSKEGAEG
jgi:hypothetical protein